MFRLDLKCEWTPDLSDEKEKKGKVTLGDQGRGFQEGSSLGLLSIMGGRSRACGEEPLPRERGKGGGKISSWDREKKGMKLVHLSEAAAPSYLEYEKGEGKEGRGFNKMEKIRFSQRVKEGGNEGRGKGEEERSEERRRGGTGGGGEIAVKGKGGNMEEEGGRGGRGGGRKDERRKRGEGSVGPSVDRKG